MDKYLRKNDNGYHGVLIRKGDEFIPATTTIRLIIYSFYQYYLHDIPETIRDLDKLDVHQV